jgi:integrase
MALGRRDHTLLLLAAQTGLRLSELISLDRDAIHLGAGAHVRCVGKGRKERCTPLTLHARGVLQVWLKEPARRGASALFPNVHGGNRTNVASEPASGRTIACSPSFRRCRKPDYAEWSWGNVRSMGRKRAQTGPASRTVRHSSAGGINRLMPRAA